MDPSGATDAMYGPGAGDDTRGADGPLPFSTSRVPTPSATSNAHSSATRWNAPVTTVANTVLPSADHSGEMSVDPVRSLIRRASDPSDLAIQRLSAPDSSLMYASQAPPGE